MKKLTEIIVKYSKKYVNENNDWYNWREINEDKLPMGIELPKGNQYLKNVILKKELNKKWKESQSVENKLILIKYYIATWGGIHTNSSESMEEYSKLSASQLIKNGKKGKIIFWLLIALVPLIEPLLKVGFPYHLVDFCFQLL